MGNRFCTAVRCSAMTCMVAALGLTDSASATLLDRGRDFVYDDVLNITWTRQASDGVLRDWPEANARAANLDVDGIKGWRLPYASVSAGAGPTNTAVDCATSTEQACRDNELGYMYYYDLGGSGNNKTGNQTAVGGQKLAGIQPDYWSGTEFTAPGAGPNQFWNSNFVGGFLNHDTSPFFLASAWAVRPGDVGIVPEPSSLVLMAVGLLGLVSTLSGRRRRLSFGRSDD